MSLAPGIYEALLDEDLDGILRRHPELRSVFGKIDPEEEPPRYAAFVSKVLEQALRQEADPGLRLQLCNQLIERISARDETAFLQTRRLIPAEKPLLLEVTPSHCVEPGMPRPDTPLAESSLFTGSRSDPQLVHELLQEIRTADMVDILISFIKWAGLRLLMPGFEDLARRGVRVRVITTSYMGASDAEAIEWLGRQPNVEVRVSYDTERTRLHAKAYHFSRKSGYSTAYIGSANMSHAAMTSGLEWNLKVTAQDMPHILEKFAAEFETYWNSQEFLPFDTTKPERLREALRRASQGTLLAPFFPDMTPHPFQQRILEALEAEREVRNHRRNLIVAATGTGKTVVAAFDYKRFCAGVGRPARLLFVAHRREILEQSLGCFQAVLRDQNFGALLVGPHQPQHYDHLFCSVDSLTSRKLWERLGAEFYEYIVVDEVHHGPAESYRPIFDFFHPQILLGLTATPERMDGKSVTADFEGRLAAEIRLPEALEEKLLCPFHYFAVSDPVSLKDEKFWANGRYVTEELEKIYTGAHILAQQRLDAILGALQRYEPDLSRIRGVGFCVSVEHARFMARSFNDHGIRCAELTGETSGQDRTEKMAQFRRGELTFIFTVDLFNEGVDVPDINTVLFLRPTESLTVFLQQLGRGLRHAPEKDCLMVLDFVGQTHRRYRIDRKLAALLPKHRFNIKREVEEDFPHLPPGCCIQLERCARDHILESIRQSFLNLQTQVTELVKTFENESGQPLTLGNFVTYHDYEPDCVLRDRTWSEWKAQAGLQRSPQDPDLDRLRQGLLRAAQLRAPAYIRDLKRLLGFINDDPSGTADLAPERRLMLHYLLWGKPGPSLEMASLEESAARLATNPSVLADISEVADWAIETTSVLGLKPALPFECPLELHGTYSTQDIKAALGASSFERSGPTGVGVFHVPAKRVYALIFTFRKTEKDFSPSTMYADYPLSLTRMHWQSQSTTTQDREMGQNLIHHKERGYTILLFARLTKKTQGITSPFTYLGPARRISFEGELPITIVWELPHPMPAGLFEDARVGG
jgi:superfamily II DNA or RNA helicase